ncbi:hypothetical protein B7494_g1760 [Chlorociboria aeruginascens]|nr:hypothetical protein B7494_g1760 [Chlorociboria aeruginascens]
MSKLIQYCISLFILGQCYALPLGEQITLSPDPGVSHGKNKFVLAVFDAHAPERFREIRMNREGYQYGSPLLGNTSYFPTGVLGDARVLSDKQLWYQDVQYITNNVNNIEWPQAAQALAEAGGLQNLSSFNVIYENQWQYTIPDGVSPGILTNWTQDHLFSMERLSTNPYVVRRLHPANDTLPFLIEENVVRQVAGGVSLDELHNSGRLFFADHSVQKRFPINPGRWAAACSAYFFIHPKSGEFLPLAIKTNVETDLIYTPLDDENDWLFGKMAFELNDLFHGQIYHLSNTHDIAEPVYLAALRTLSIRHPIRGFLDRVMYRAFAVRPIGDEVLFNDGGFFDSSFAPTNFAGRSLSSYLYDTGAGFFQSTQFAIDLPSRGLVNCTYGPALKTMPFYDTVNPMVLAINEFITTYVEAYYPSDALLEQDQELQAWMLETIEKAQVIDFPSFPLTSRSTLASILAHISFLAGVAHHVLNGATPGESSGILPLHPSAFNKPLPTTKGSIDDLMPYLHNETEALKQASLLVRFNRPLLEEHKESLVYMFSGKDFLSQTMPTVEHAAEKFERQMEMISDEIRGQKFDERGLAQGMPFIWRSMDPRRIPYYLSV